MSTLTPIRSLRALYAYATLVRDPNQLGKVFDLRSSLEDPAATARVLAFLEADQGCREALREQSRLGRIDLDALGKKPQGSLGRAFADHMRAAGLDPAAIPLLESSSKQTFVSAHLYETHDIWHAVTGFGTDIAGELGLQAFYLAQLPAFLAAAILSAGLLNTMLFGIDERERRMDAIVRGWELGRRARPLFGVRWADRWSEDLASLRASFDLPAGGVDAPRHS